MKMFRKITAILTVVIGIGVIALGAFLMMETADHDVADGSFRYTANTYDASDYDAEYASFGGDFYTYIYRSSDIIVDELDEINKGVAAVNNSMNNAMATMVRAQNSVNAAVTANVRATDDLIDTVNKVAGMLLIAIGLTVFLWGMQSVGVAFVPAETVKPKEDEAVVSDEEKMEV